MKPSNKPQDLLLNQIISKVTRFNVMRCLYITVTLSFAVLFVSACAVNNSPASESIPTETISPTPTATPIPTATPDPFEGLNTCRTWREAVNCPITEKDFRRISDYVKANYKFPPEALRVKNLELNLDPSYMSFGFVYIKVSEEGLKAKTSEKVWRPEYPQTNLESSLRPTGKPFFFNLKANPPVINWDVLVTVYPVNNADGILGTYTIYDPVSVPYIRSGPPKSEAEKGTREWIEKTMITIFEKWTYCPPRIALQGMVKKNREKGWTGTLELEIFKDTMDPKGKRKELLDEWMRTAIIPQELEEMPMFAC